MKKKQKLHTWYDQQQPLFLVWSNSVKPNMRLESTASYRRHLLEIGQNYIEFFLQKYQWQSLLYVVAKKDSFVTSCSLKLHGPKSAEWPINTKWLQLLLVNWRPLLRNKASTWNNYHLLLRALRYAALRTADLDGTRFWIGSKCVWATRIWDFFLENRGFLLLLPR